MNGRAPNSSVTGFHSLVHRKARPNLWRDRAELSQSLNTSKRVTRSMLAAKAMVSKRATLSPVCPEGLARDASTANGVAMLLSVARSGYFLPGLICAICLISLATTSLGSGAYQSAPANFCPSASIHPRNALMVVAFFASWISLGTSSHVKVEMGYDFLPGALVMETRKSAGISLAVPAAASVTEARSALTKLPAAFLTSPDRK